MTTATPKSKTAPKAPARPPAQTAAKTTRQDSAKAAAKSGGRSRKTIAGKTTPSPSGDVLHPPAMESPASVAVQIPPAALPPGQTALRLRDLIERVADATGQRRPEVKAALEAALAALGQSLDEGRGLNLPPLGKIRVGKARPNSGGEGKPPSGNGGRTVTLKLRRENPAPGEIPTTSGSLDDQQALAEPEEAS